MYELLPTSDRSLWTTDPSVRHRRQDKGLKLSADGSIEIYLQHLSPGINLESNWLPAPPGCFVYPFEPINPRADPEGEYVLPWIERVK